MTTEFLKSPPPADWHLPAVSKAHQEELDALGAVADHLAKSAAATPLASVYESFHLPIFHFDKFTASKNSFFVKLNHGFWEKLHLAFSSKFVPVVHPTISRSNERQRILESRFFFGLKNAFESAISLGDSGSNLFIAVGFGPGKQAHEELKSSMLTTLEARRARASWAGLNLFLESTPRLEPPAMFDAASPKNALLSGELKSVVQKLGSVADSVFLIVPDHFPRLFIPGVRRDKQSTLFVSGTHALETWPLMLASLSKPILSRLLAGQNVLVVVQAAAAATLLGLYLHNLTSRLKPTGQIHFLDVGQVFDSAVPRARRGPWAQRYPVARDHSIVTRRRF